MLLPSYNRWDIHDTFVYVLNVCYSHCILGCAEYEKAKAILGVRRSAVSVRPCLHPLSFCVQGSKPWHQRCKYCFQLCTADCLGLKFTYDIVCQIGKLQEGLNPPSWNMLHFTGTYLGLIIKTGIITGIISLTVNPISTHLPVR